MNAEEAIAMWLSIKSTEVKGFVLIHRCKPLPVEHLLTLLDSVLENHENAAYDRFMDGMNPDI